jgi:para-aminobenzoate synthetase component 1
MTMRVKRVTNVAFSDLSTIFREVSNRPWSILLDSASPEHPDNKWDIAVFDPVKTITFLNHRSLVKDLRSGQISFADQEPFSLVQQLLDDTLTAQTDLSLPFIGGAVGFWSYDMGRQIEKLPNLAKRDIFLPDMCVGIYDQALLLNKQTGELFMVAPDASQMQQLEQWLFQTLASLPDAPTDEFTLTSDWHSNMTLQQYADRFASIQEYLLSGDCYQINLAQRFRAGYQGNEWAAYRRLRKENAAPFSSFMRLDQGCILSISPERFIQVRQNRIETKPIKGTRPRNAEPTIDARIAEELRQSEKDRAENLMIVDLLRNDLGKVAAPGSVKVPKLFEIESFPAVHHLVSTITARLDEGKRPMDLLRGAFPGGSITGAPKVRAMQIIEELEPHRRHIYCGAIGYLSINGNMDTSIAIRTLVCQDNQIYAWGGGGIVADSDCDSEYQETLAKLQRILPILVKRD